MNDINRDTLKFMELEAIERYNRRLEQHGQSPLSLGWSSLEHQNIRFQAAIQNCSFSHQSVLDIGCGFSDLYRYIQAQHIPISSYYGIDINKDFIKSSQAEFPQNIYEQRNFLISKYDKPQAEVVVLLGLLNFKLTNISNIEFTQYVMKEAFALCEKTLILDFLSTDLNPEYPKEDFVFYHDPKEVLAWGQKLSSRAKIVDDYPPIPQNEFMLILQK